MKKALERYLVKHLQVFSEGLENIIHFLDIIQDIQLEYLMLCFDRVTVFTIIEAVDIMSQDWYLRSTNHGFDFLSLIFLQYGRTELEESLQELA